LEFFCIRWGFPDCPPTEPFGPNESEAGPRFWALSLEDGPCPPGPKSAPWKFVAPTYSQIHLWDPCFQNLGFPAGPLRRPQTHIGGPAFPQWVPRVLVKNWGPHPPPVCGSLRIWKPLPPFFPGPQKKKKIHFPPPVRLGPAASPNVKPFCFSPLSPRQSRPSTPFQNPRWENRVPCPKKLTKIPSPKSLFLAREGVVPRHAVFVP